MSFNGTARRPSGATVCAKARLRARTSCGGTAFAPAQPCRLRARHRARAS